MKKTTAKRATINNKKSEVVTPVKAEVTPVKPKRHLTFRPFSFIMNIVTKSIERIHNSCKRLQFIILKAIRGLQSQFGRLLNRKEVNMAKSNKNAKNADTKTNKKAEKKATKSSDKGFMFGILGIAIAMVVVSIAYSTAVILLGTKGVTPKIMLAPQALFDVVILGYAFSKIFK